VDDTRTSIQSLDSAPVVVIITGAPASGKSTLGPPLARSLDLPYLSKDLFKESLFETLGVSDRAWSQRLGAASMELLFKSAAAVLEAGQSLAVESNFHPHLSASEFRALAERYHCRFIQILCTASGKTLVERFERRVLAGHRHPGHADADTLDEWRARLLERPWQAMDLPGSVISVNTDGNVDLDLLITRIRAALSVAGIPS
jgi:predicted kinase